MKINVLTLFPEMFEALNSSVLKRAMEKNLIEIDVFDIRSFSTDKHKRCDDYPFGGGAGMIMTVQPIDDAFLSVDADRKSHRIYLSPKGERLTQKKVIELSQFDELTLLCGHYEGVDERALKLHIDEEISIGDYVLTGGELPAMVLIDSVSRYVKGVLGSSLSTEEESFSGDFLEYPQFTRPQNYKGMEVPSVLVGGNHAEIEKWKKAESLRITIERRPDLLKDNK